MQGTSSFIRIKPDWNVKVMLAVAAVGLLVIRIKPDWNVKKLAQGGYVRANTLE